MSPAYKILLVHLISKSLIEEADSDKVPNSTLAENVVKGIHDSKIAFHAGLQITSLNSMLKIVRTAEDADPNWTDDQICEMIIDKMEEKTPRIHSKLKSLLTAERKRCEDLTSKETETN